MSILGNDVTAIPASLIFLVFLRISRQTARSSIIKHYNLCAVAKFESNSIIMRTDTKKWLAKLGIVTARNLFCSISINFMLTASDFISKIRHKFEKKYDWRQAQNNQLMKIWLYRSVYVHFLGLLALQKTLFIFIQSLKCSWLWTNIQNNSITYE